MLKSSGGNIYTYEKKAKWLNGDKMLHFAWV